MLREWNKRVSRKLLIFVLIIALMVYTDCKKKRKNRFRDDKHRTTKRNMDKFSNTRTLCMNIDNTLRARHKTCFLRPDTGPCRADIVQWYFDVKQRVCYRFFWGGCQGNGNRFDSKNECINSCLLNTTETGSKIPYFCNLAFDFGTCFGHYNRWGWDALAKTCKRRLYSGCGGNQNNFETKYECLATCLRGPNNSVTRFHQFTTCIPFQIAELQ